MDVYNLFTDIFDLPHELVLSDLPLDDISQIASNKSSYANWQSRARQKLYEEGGKK
ncbi:hypothetical protein RV01_GL001224 [Enterococcus dispar]|nr:hypothetical protein RV01_GL001224 [Enterococcus dispar]